jgi:hypothetical protein
MNDGPPLPGQVSKAQSRLHLYLASLVIMRDVAKVMGTACFIVALAGGMSAAAFVLSTPGSEMSKITSSIFNALLAPSYYAAAGTAAAGAWMLATRRLLRSGIQRLNGLEARP